MFSVNVTLCRALLVLCCVVNRLQITRYNQKILFLFNKSYNIVSAFALKINLGSNSKHQTDNLRGDINNYGNM